MSIRQVAAQYTLKRNFEGLEFFAIGQITEKGNWLWFEIILRIVLRFQFDSARFQRGEVSANFCGKVK